MKLLSSILAAAIATSCAAATVVYDVTMRLHVPRVYDNAGSQGYRRYQTQKLSGTLELTTDCASEPQAKLVLENQTHKVGGVRVSYETTVGDVRWHAVGSNRTGKFDRASVTISFDALPSYVPTYSPTDDESLVLTLSGSGTAKRIKGYAAGSLGCGCSWYGHVSPTRIMWTDAVVDTAAVWGSFRMKARKD